LIIIWSIWWLFDNNYLTIIWRIWWLFGKMWTRTQFRFRQAQDAPSKSRRPDLHDERILQQCGARERVRWWGLRQRTEREQGMWGDRDGVVVRERVPHTPVRSYARTHAHTHALCVCLYKYMFASAYVCTSANGQADHNTGWSWGFVEGQELAQVRSACPGVHQAHLETNCHHLEPLQIAKT